MSISALGTLSSQRNETGRSREATNAVRSSRNRRSVAKAKMTVSVAAIADGMRAVSSVTRPAGQLASPIAA
jgi:hypothetical protein